MMNKTLLYFALFSFCLYSPGSMAEAAGDVSMQSVLPEPRLREEAPNMWGVGFVHPASGVNGSVTIDSKGEDVYAMVVLGSEKRIYDRRSSFIRIPECCSFENVWVEFSDDPEQVFIVYSVDGSTNSHTSEGKCNIRYLLSDSMKSGLKSKISSLGCYSALLD